MREYHSPSSVELGRRCRRAWFYRYVEGIRSPEVPWTPELKGKARSLALGKAVHATIEAHYQGDQPDWLWLPGEIAASGLHLLPDVTSAPGEFYVEVPIGFNTGREIGPGHDGKPRFVIDVAGVPWLGFRDLVHGPEGRLYDHKTTGSIADYAKSPATLLQDLQANLYAYDTMLERGTDEIECRWVYYETRKVRRAAPVDFVIKRAEAYTVIECAAEVAKELDAITEIDHAPMNVHACADYGGCEFHVKQGGPCSASVPVGQLIQARVRKDPNPMPLDLSKLPNIKKPAPAPEATTTEPPAANTAPPVDTAAPAPGPVGSDVSPAKPARGRPARSAVGASGSLASIAAELTAAEAAHLETAAALDAAKTKMREALA